LKFAENIKVFGKVSTANEQLQLQEDINTLIKWSEEWQMLLNTSKCRDMHFGHSNAHAEYQMNSQ